MPAVIQGVLVCGRRGWGWPGRSRTGIGCSSPLAPVGAGLCPSPASRVDGGFKRICRGRPVCRPVNGSREDLPTGGHIGPPLRGGGGVWEPTGIGAGRKSSPTGRGGARPLQGIGGVRGEVRSPRPTEAPQVVRSNGPMWASAPTKRSGNCRDLPGSALSAERVAGQIQSLPDNIRVQHGVLCSEV